MIQRKIFWLVGKTEEEKKNRVSFKALGERFYAINETGSHIF